MNFTCSHNIINQMIYRIPAHLRGTAKSKATGESIANYQAHVYARERLFVEDYFARLYSKTHARI